MILKLNYGKSKLVLDYILENNFNKNLLSNILFDKKLYNKNNFFL